MKRTSTTKVLVGVAIAFGVALGATTIVSQPSNACPAGQSVPCDDESNIFFCDERRGAPTTAVKTPSGVMPVIRWVSHAFLPSGFDPLTRCRDVSARFQTYYDNGKLDYITTGIVNGQPVVCVTDSTGGPCQGILFTLKRGQSASRVIQQLFDIRAGASGPLYESQARFYLDMNKYLQNRGLANQ
jgi:hypothetical protein